MKIMCIDENVWIIGAGNMAAEYSKILKKLSIKHSVIGRSSKSAEGFYEKTGLPVHQGGIEQIINSTQTRPRYAIIAVNVEMLYNACKTLIINGVKNILIEKPAGCNQQQVMELSKIAKQYNSNVLVAYNRRFYASVIEAKKIIEKDDGVKSFSFEFTEWSHVIEKLAKPKDVLQNWLLANSSHVIDLAFYLGGYPSEMSTYTKGSLSWYDTAAIFAGAGITKSGALFSYNANWKGPGRWVVDVVTSKHRLLFKPIEKLQIQEIGSTSWNFVDVDYRLDDEFKPGLYLQTKYFLEDKIDERFITIHEHSKHMVNYNLIEKK